MGGEGDSGDDLRVGGAGESGDDLWVEDAGESGDDGIDLVGAIGDPDKIRVWTKLTLDKQVTEILDLLISLYF